jgi:hypothetical protein
VVEKAYNYPTECDTDESKMLDEGFEVESDYHDIWQFYRKYTRTAED